MVLCFLLLGSVGSKFLVVYSRAIKCLLACKHRLPLRYTGLPYIIRVVRPKCHSESMFLVRISVPQVQSGII